MVTMFTSPVISLASQLSRWKIPSFSQINPNNHHVSITHCSLLLPEAQLLSFLLWEAPVALAAQAPHHRPLPQASAFVTSFLKLSSRLSSGASFRFLNVGAVCELEDKPSLSGSRLAHFSSRLCLPPRGDWGPLVSEAPGDS